MGAKAAAWGACGDDFAGGSSAGLPSNAALILSRDDKPSTDRGGVGLLGGSAGTAIVGGV